MPIALDATYSIGRHLSGVGAYSRRILSGLTEAHPEERFLFCYRPNRFLRSFGERLPSNASRRLLQGPVKAELYHALNQRLHFRVPRTVTTFHDLFVMTGEYSSPEFRERFTRQARDAAERSDLIIAVSSFTASQVRDLLGVEAERIRVVHHGVDMPDRWPGAREKLVLSVGAIQKRKNIARLVKAFERLPAPWRLALAGAAGGWGACAELQGIETSSAKSRIDVLGYVSSAELDALYRRAAVFAFPSLDEGFGMPVLEAMAHGVPVVTSMRSALPEVAGDAALLVDPSDADALSEALVRLAADESLREDLASKGCEQARSFPWAKAVANTWAVYHEIKR